MLECLRQALFQRTRIVAEFAFGLGAISKIRRSGADAQIFGSIQLRHRYDLLDDTHDSGHSLHHRGRDGVAWGGNTSNILGDMQDLDERVSRTSDNVALAHHALLHCQNVAARNIIYMHPGEGRTCRDDRQFALQVQEKGRAYAARVFRTIDHPWQHDDERQASGDHRISHLVVSHPLRAIILAQVLAREAIGLINELTMRIRIDRERTGLDSLLNAQLLHQLQNVACPVDIDLYSIALVLHTDFIPSGDMQNAIGATHSLAHTLFVSHITPGNCDAQPGQFLRLRRIAHDRDDLVACINKLAHDMISYKTSRSGYKVFHLSFSFSRTRSCATFSSGKCPGK